MFANVRSVRSQISCFRKRWWTLAYCLYHCTIIYMSTILNLNEDWKRMRWRASTSTKVECAWKSLLKTTEFRKYCNQARLSFKRSSGLSNAYMDTTSGLYVLQEHKDKTTFLTIKTIHWRSLLCRGMYWNEDKTTFDDLWYVSMLSRIFFWWNLFDWLIKTELKKNRFEGLKNCFRPRKNQ